MKTKRKILVVILAVGIFISGAGAAAAFLDFSSFKYNEQVVIGAENLKDATLYYDFDDSQIDQINITNPINYSLSNSKAISVMADENMPEGRIRLELSYNPEEISKINLEGNIIERECLEADDYKIKRILQIDVIKNYVYRSDMEIYMNIYSDSLRNLKNRSISSYRLAEVEKCVIRVNPKYEQMIVY